MTTTRKFGTGSDIRYYVETETAKLGWVLRMGSYWAAWMVTSEGNRLVSDGEVTRSDAVEILVRQATREGLI